MTSKTKAAQGEMIATLDDDIDNAVSVTPARSDKAAPAAEAQGSAHDDEMSGDRVDIYIYAGHEENGSAPVPVGVNGVVYYIPRAKKVNVPVEVVGVLQNAVTDVHEPRGDNKGVDIRQAPATRSRSSARCKPVGTASAVPIQKRSTRCALEWARPHRTTKH